MPKKRCLSVPMIDSPLAKRRCFDASIAAAPPVIPMSPNRAAAPPVTPNYPNRATTSPSPSIHLPTGTALSVPTMAACTSFDFFCCSYILFIFSHFLVHFASFASHINENGHHHTIFS